MAEQCRSLENGTPMRCEYDQGHQGPHSFDAHLSHICPKSIHCFRGADHEGACRDNACLADGHRLDPAVMRLVMRDGDEIVYGRCPGCGAWAELDDDQLHGRVSTDHNAEDGGCGYHETKDWWADHVA